MENKAQNLVNERFKIFIQEQRLKQTDLAKLFGVSNQTVNAMTKGKQGITPEHAYKLQKEYNLNVDWLYTGNNSMLLNSETTNITVEMFEALKKDLEMFRAMCAKLMGLENLKETSDFNSGSSQATGAITLPLFPEMNLTQYVA